MTRPMYHSTLTGGLRPPVSTSNEKEHLTEINEPRHSVFRSQQKLLSGPMYVKMELKITIDSRLEVVSKKKTALTHYSRHLTHTLYIAATFSRI